MLSACDQKGKQYHCEQHPTPFSSCCFEGLQNACKGNRRVAERCYHYPFCFDLLQSLRCHACNAKRWCFCRKPSSAPRFAFWCFSRAVGNFELPEAQGDICIYTSQYLGKCRSGQWVYFRVGDKSLGLMVDRYSCGGDAHK